MICNYNLISRNVEGVNEPFKKLKYLDFKRRILFTTLQETHLKNKTTTWICMSQAMVLMVDFVML